MSVTQEGEVIRVTGAGRIEDAEALLAMLQCQPGCRVDLTLAEQLHTAVVQVLLAFRPQLVKPAGDAFLNTWVIPNVAPGS